MDDFTNSDAGLGTTPPELGKEGQNLVGRPSEEAPVGFKAPEKREAQRQKVDLATQERSGGSFDQAGIPPEPIHAVSEPLKCP